MASKEEEIQRLIEMMHIDNNESNNNHAQTAISILRTNGWLEDGSLQFADLSYADLSFANLRSANLSWANLSRTHLYECDLNEANLTEVNLTNANLRRANLSKVELYNADLTNVDLREANLSDANLTGVSLKYALLEATNFSRTVLNRSNFVSSICSLTIFAGVDLSTAIGLERIQHYESSTLGIDTLFTSRGKIPEIFLRSCGIPETLITYLPVLMSTAIDFYSCFISYSHVDQSFARRVHETLQGRGIRCWLDEKEVLPGDDIYKEIDRGIRYWDKVLLCCSEKSLTGWWVDHEIDKAFNKERELMKDRGEKVLALIPLDLDGYLFSDECKAKSPKSAEIRNRIAGNFNGWESDNPLFEREIEKVIRALRTDGGKAPPPSPKL
jgi:hypothetical protein